MGSCGTTDTFQDGRQNIDEIVKNRNQKNNNDNKGKISSKELDKIRKSICNISYERHNEEYFVLGFFLESNYFPKCITTNNIDITEKDLNKEKINVEIFNKKKICIELNGEERYIQVFGYLGILLIEIKDSDEIINDINFLE